MAISKRLRFEVYRRDNHTCRYCGRSAPEVKLTIDHVMPETLGGTDDPTNLVTACEDCNAGKTSIAPDSPIVEDIKDQALRWSIAVREAARIRRAEREKARVIGDYFRDEIWERFYFGDDEESGTRAPLPADWRDTIERFWSAELPWEDIDAAARLAMENTKVLVEDKFRYFCGVCWRMIGDIQETALKIVDTIDLNPPAPKSKQPVLPREESMAMARAAAREAAARAAREKWQG